VPWPLHPGEGGSRTGSDLSSPSIKGDVRHDWEVLFLRPNLSELSEGDGVGFSDLVST
jgi:hypothetical protein